MEGDVIIARIAQADENLKSRPAIVLRQMLGYGDWLICGISTKLHQQVTNFDEIISPADDDFVLSGLNAPSLIRLGHLIVVAPNSVAGAIGTISPQRHRRLLQKLSDYLIK
jgi:mRNA interferase MazF